MSSAVFIFTFTFTFNAFVDMLASSLITLSFLALPFTLVASQSSSSNNTQLGIAVIEANFENAGIVPSLLAQFDPTALLTVSFANGDLTPGQNLSQSDVQPTPTITVTAGNSSVQLGPHFTLAMVDADVVGTDQSQGQTRHWLVNNVTLSSSSPAALDFSSAKNITNYAGPAPPAGSGPHRYVILLYTQPDSFTPPANLSTTTGVAKFDFPQYVQSTGLIGPVAGFYFQVEQGVATVSLSSTSAVVVSTLAAAQSNPPASATSASVSPTKSNGSKKRAAPAVFWLTALLGGLIL